MTTSSPPPRSVGVITVRPARPSEYAAVGDLALAAYSGDGLIEDDSDYATELRNAADRAEHCDLLVAVDDVGALLGTVTYCLPGSPYAELSRDGQAEFRMLAVAPSARGQGVGARLVRACIDRAARHGCRSLVLSSRPQMQAARALYDRLGFERTPHLDWTPMPNIELLAYTKTL